ncbi:MAG TPA: NAD(P)H-hydrate dehydratase [Planctomycetes bacterium]|nr:NAD(P)H-hydrate dehydratase [Planctomycetota bacterium]
MASTQDRFDLPPPCRLPPRPLAAHKGSFGKVVLLAGSRRYAGAAALAAAGAGRGGAGLVVVGTPSSAVPIVRHGAPSRIVRSLPEDSEGRVAFPALRLLRSLEANALVVGPGLDQSDGLTALLARWLPERPEPAVLDADALNLAARDRRILEHPSDALRVLTPHPGEAARLLGMTTEDVQSDRPAAARALASSTGAVVVLKGHRTVVDDGHRRWTNVTGNPGMATGGMGDILAGLIGALLLQGIPDAVEAVRLAVHVHGRAADLARDRVGETALLPEDVLTHLPHALLEAGA